MNLRSLKIKKQWTNLILLVLGLGSTPCFAEYLDQDHHLLWSDILTGNSTTTHIAQAFSGDQAEHVCEMYTSTKTPRAVWHLPNFEEYQTLLRKFSGKESTIYNSSGEPMKSWRLTNPAELQAAFDQDRPAWMSLSDHQMRHLGINNSDIAYWTRTFGRTEVGDPVARMGFTLTRPNRVGPIYGGDLLHQAIFCVTPTE